MMRRKVARRAQRYAQAFPQRLLSPFARCVRFWLDAAMRLLLGSIALSISACASQPSAPQRVMLTPTDCDTRTTAGPFDRGCAAKTMVEHRNAARVCGFEGHAKITFAPNGAVEAVAIDVPSTVEPEAAACVEKYSGKHTFRRSPGRGLYPSESRYSRAAKPRKRPPLTTVLLRSAMLGGTGYHGRR